jgi:hypothetical protein
MASFATNVLYHYSPIQGSPIIDWCINQFTNVEDPTNNGQCVMAEDQSPGNFFDTFRDYCISYFNAGSNSDDTHNFFPHRGGPCAGPPPHPGGRCQLQLGAPPSPAHPPWAIPVRAGTTHCWQLGPSGSHGHLLVGCSATVSGVPATTISSPLSPPSPRLDHVITRET